MNILQILPELNVGGVETGTIDLAKYLVRQGHNAIVISNGGSMVKDLEAVGGRHYQLPVHRKSLFTMVKMVSKVADIIKKENIDVVHARSRVPGWIAFLASRKAGCPMVTTCHGYYRKRFFSQVMGWGKFVIVPSNVIAQHMIEDFGAPHERLRLVPRSVDLEKFKYVSPDKKKSDTFHIGIIGRLTSIKGHIYFLQAMARVIRTVPKVKIWIVGGASASKASYKEEIEIMVRRLGLGHCTEFLGSQRDIPAVMSTLNLMVCGSIYPEAFGRVIVEAQASGVPVVATKVGGIVDIIDEGVTGLMVPPRDPSAMAEAIIKLIKDPQLRKQLSENAYKKVQDKFNVELMVKRTLDVYKEAVSNLNILVIKFSSLGDIILSSAAIKAVRDKFNKATGENSSANKITLLTSMASKEVFNRCPYIDELQVLDLKEKGLRAALRLGKQLRKKKFDIVIDLQNNRFSHLLSALTFSLNRYGYNNGKLGFLLNHSIKDDKAPIDPVTHQFRVLKLLNIELKDNRLEMWPAKEDEVYVDEFLRSQWISSQQRLIGINICASRKWATKAWPRESIIKLCEALSAKDMRVVLTGTESDLPEAKLLVDAIKNVKPIVACGKTGVNQLYCLVKKCNVYISPDSAPLHIACAGGTPFIALFGPTDLRRHLCPSKNGIVLTSDMLCSPCYKPKCRTRECMRKIRVEDVLASIEKLLGENK